MVEHAAIIRTLPVTIATAEGILVDCLSGFVMRPHADLHADEASPCPVRDVAIINAAVRATEHTLRSPRRDNEPSPDLITLCSFATNPADQIAPASN